MRLLAAKPGDAPQLATILAEWKAETPWISDPPSRDEDTRFLAMLIGTIEVSVLRDWRRPQGFLARDGAMIHALYLAPRARGQGHGRRLLNAAKRRSGQLMLWTFQANTGARAFYAREGFVEVELSDGAGNDEKLPDVRLVWQRGESDG